MMANNTLTVTLFGATGSLGRYVSEKLAMMGARVYIPFRGCESEVRHMRVPYDLGRVGLIPYSPRDQDSVRFALERSDVVVNMIGKTYETKHMVPTRRANGKLSRVNYSFEEVHIDIPQRLAEWSKEAGVERFIHVGALGSNPDSASQWARTKFEGEQAVKEAFFHSSIVRPAMMFGPYDRFLTKIPSFYTRPLIPIVPLVNGGVNTMQPVFAVDVAEAIVRLIDEADPWQTTGTFNLAGPEKYTLREIYELVWDITMMNPTTYNVPLEVVKLMGKVMELYPDPFITEDEMIVWSEDCYLEKEGTQEEGQFRTFQDLKIKPASLETEAFHFLNRYREGGHFVRVEGYHGDVFRK
jgi:NADH dehydrogenase (ubiquinone) 1 alpha subcomplex subunit 9